MVSKDGSNSFGKTPEYIQEAVNHGEGKFVRSSVQTSNIEGFWSLFKRGYYGIQYRLTFKYLHRFLEKFTVNVGIRSIHTIAHIP